MPRTGPFLAKIKVRIKWLNNYAEFFTIFDKRFFDLFQFLNFRSEKLKPLFSGNFVHFTKEYDGTVKLNSFSETKIYYFYLVNFDLSILKVLSN